MNDFMQDLKRGFRRLRREPGFAIVALACLGLGIGANTAVFSVVNAVLLRPLPFEDPKEISQIWTESASATTGTTQYFSRVINFEEFRKTSEFQSMAALVDIDFDLSGGLGDSERVRGGRTTVELFDVLGTQPLLGRLFTADDGESGQGDVVVISDGLFQRRYGGDPDAVGRTLYIDGRPHTLIGVIPERSGYPMDGAVWIPLVIADLSEQERVQGMLTALGRLAEGTDLAQARAGLEQSAEVLRRMYPDENNDLGLGVDRLDSQLVQDVQGRVLALGIGVLMLLAIACANVANLLLVRLNRESRSAALRCALGANRKTLIRQFLTENSVLAGAGGVLGVLLAYLAVPSLIGLMPDNVAGFDQVRVDVSALAFGLFAATATLLPFGLVPAFSGSTPHLNSVLKSSGRTGGTKGSKRLQSAFVTLQIAIGIVLLIGSSLLMKSLTQVGAVDPGFEPQGVLTFRMNAAEVRYPEHEDRVDFFRRVLEGAESIPGVTAAGAAHVLPIGDIPWGMGFSLEDLPPADPGQTEVAFYRLVTPGYLEAMGVPLLEGRDFTDDDSLESLQVALVSQELVNRYWPGESGIGKRIKRRGYYSENPWITVVGVVGDIHDTGLPDTVGGAIYLARGQYDRSYASVMSVVLRTNGEPESFVTPVQNLIREIDPNVPLFRIRTLEDILHESIAAERFTAILLLVFSGLGLTLAGVGVYGVMAHVVRERRREIALRMTFGARTSSVAGLMLAGAARLAVAGVALGLLGSLGLTRLMDELLFEVEVLDATVFLGVPASMVLVAIVSCLVPAVTAARVDPGVTLRSD